MYDDSESALNYDEQVERWVAELFEFEAAILQLERAARYLHVEGINGQVVEHRILLTLTRAPEVLPDLARVMELGLDHARERLALAATLFETAREQLDHQIGVALERVARWS